VVAVAVVGLIILGVGYHVHVVSGGTLLRGSPVSTSATPSTVASTPTRTTAPAPARGPNGARSAGPSPSRAPTSATSHSRSRPSPMPGATTTAAPSRRARDRGFPLRPVPLPTVPPPTLEFVISTFNVLGASHTSPTGKDPGRASGPVRAVRAAELIRRHGADVIGFQELQRSQLLTLRRHTDLDFYPGLAFGDPENSIGWRREEFVAVEEHTVRIPYFDGGPRSMPFVKLRSRGTGLEAWFANFHNPAETAQYHHQQPYRDDATRIEIALADQLITRTGLPVFVTGDMNERASYFCRFTAGTPMVAARGGSNNGRCLAGHPRAVDWIFASQGVDVLDYVEDRSHLVDITTDHPVVVARVRITGKPPAD
jgi:hypothetical protein